MAVMLCLITLAGCGEKITAESLLKGAGEAPGMRANLSVSAELLSGTRKQTAAYSGTLAAKDYVRYMKGDARQGSMDLDLEYYIRYVPEAAKESCLELYNYRPNDGIWAFNPYKDTMITHRELFSSIENVNLAPAPKDTASYTVTGEIPLEAIRSFAELFCCGPGTAAVILQMPDDQKLHAEIVFNAMNKMPTSITCTLPAPVELRSSSLEIFTVELRITDMNLTSLEIPPEVLAAGK